MTSKQANIAGVVAIMFWASAALFFSVTKDIPPLLHLSLNSLFAGLVFLPIWLYKTPSINGLLTRFNIPLKTILLPLLGLGLYRILYYYGLTMAPIAEANLVNYLWPVFILIFASFLPGQTLKPRFIIGAVFCLFGLYLLRINEGFYVPSFQMGHAIAFLAAVTFGLYSVLTKLQKNSKSDAVPVSAIYCGLIGLLLHMAIGTSWVIDPIALAGICALGMSAGSGYFLWDIAMKHGDIHMLGILSYFTPLFSTVLLISFGYPTLTHNLSIAALCIVFGTLFAAQDNIKSVARDIKNRSVS
ncbi:MAG: DMT family transporter [Alphaproteobacteria bacterium]